MKLAVKPKFCSHTSQLENCFGSSAAEIEPVLFFFLTYTFKGCRVNRRQRFARCLAELKEIVTKKTISETRSEVSCKQISEESNWKRPNSQKKQTCETEVPKKGEAREVGPNCFHPTNHRSMLIGHPAPWTLSSALLFRKSSVYH